MHVTFLLVPNTFFYVLVAFYCARLCSTSWPLLSCGCCNFCVRQQQLVEFLLTSWRDWVMSCWRANLEFSRAPSPSRAEMYARTRVIIIYCELFCLKAVLEMTRWVNPLTEASRVQTNFSLVTQPWKTWEWQGTDMKSLKMKSLKSHGNFCSSSCSAQI